MKLPSGVASTIAWRGLRASRLFRNMERFSKPFLAIHHGALRSYSKKWTQDPLHQWSRIWEYLFVYDRIEAWRSQVERDQVRVLDVGSGVTFFPYYLVRQIPGCRLVCCDNDRSLSGVFRQVNARMSRPVEFRSGDAQRLPFADASFDAVYCISVLEHLERPVEAVAELARVLSPNGILVVTFDVSLDGMADVPLAAAQRLRDALSHRFFGDAGGAIDLAAMCRADDLLTTALVGREEPGLLPWRSARRSRLVRWIRPKAVARVPKLLTVFGESYRKAGAAAHGRAPLFPAIRSAAIGSVDSTSTV